MTCLERAVLTYILAAPFNLFYQNMESLIYMSTVGRINTITIDRHDQYTNTIILYTKLSYVYTYVLILKIGS